VSAAEDNTDLARLMLVLHPYRADLVLIGGWAHRLFRLHDLAQPLDFEALGTQDVDVAIPAKVAPRGEDLAKLLDTAGFKARFLGEDDPPVTRYEFGDEQTFYAEFLTPMVGRRGAATREIAGVSAQALRHLDVLLIEPWPVFLAPPEYPVGPRPLEIRIANAASYLAQKILVLDKRHAADRAKDVLYVHDTVLLFGRSFAELEHIWRNSIVGAIHPNAARELRDAGPNLFGQITDTARAASVIAREAGRPVAPDDIVQVCRMGLARIFT
jgi:hypothetical protein